MKKICALVVVVICLCSVFVVPSYASCECSSCCEGATVNNQQNIESIDVRLIKYLTYKDKEMTKPSDSNFPFDNIVEYKVGEYFNIQVEFDTNEKLVDKLTIEDVDTPAADIFEVEQVSEKAFAIKGQWTSEWYGSIFIIQEGGVTDYNGTSSEGLRMWQFVSEGSKCPFDMEMFVAIFVLIVLATAIILVSQRRK